MLPISDMWRRGGGGVFSSGREKSGPREVVGPPRKERERFRSKRPSREGGGWGEVGRGFFVQFFSRLKMVLEMVGESLDL